MNRANLTAIEAWAAKYYPRGKNSALGAAGYTAAQAMVLVIKQCGNDLSRDNIMRQAGSLRDVTLPMQLPGIEINTSQTERFPLKQLRLMRFNGERWVIISAPRSG